MKLLIFNPKPDESEEVLCDHLWVEKEYLKRAKRLTSSLLIYKNYNLDRGYSRYKTYHPLILNTKNEWLIRDGAYSYKPLTVVTYED